MKGITKSKLMKMKKEELVDSVLAGNFYRKEPLMKTMGHEVEIDTYKHRGISRPVETIYEAYDTLEMVLNKTFEEKVNILFDCKKAISVSLLSSSVKRGLFATEEKNINNELLKIYVEAFVLSNGSVYK